MPPSYRPLLFLGLLGLLHSGYSAAEWRGHARLAELEPVLPLDIVLQVADCFPM